MRKLSSSNKILVGIIVVLLALIGASAAQSYWGPSPSDARKIAVENRADNFNRAVAKYPDPHNVNFPMRKLLLDMNNVEDKINHPWYVYVLGDNGNTVGYYVTTTVPENACNFLSSTEDIYGNDVKMQSPSYDGVYYGNSQCTTWVMRDYATKAFVFVNNMHFYVASQPLKIAAQPIRVSTK